MNIRKLITSAVITVMTLATATCFAQISKSDLNIGGMYYGQPIQEVINRFGQPIRKEPRPPVGQFFVFQDGDSTFRVRPLRNNIVGEVIINKDSRFATKGGIRIGSSLSDIINTYGQPDFTTNNDTYIYYSTGWETVGDGEHSSNIEYLLQFILDNTGGNVTHISFLGNVEIDKGAGRSRPQTSAQHKPSQPQEPIKPKSTIPDFITQIPVSELNVGWIEPGQPMGKVEEVYGKPSKINDLGFFQTYNYNDKFIVKGKMSNGYKVTSVASYEKGMKTPSGFMVGDAYSAVVKKFGAVNGIKFKGDELEAKMKNLKGCTDYTYFSGNKQIVFLVDKKGIVQGIRVEDIDEQKFIEAKRKK